MGARKREARNARPSLPMMIGMALTTVKADAPPVLLAKGFPEEITLLFPRSISQKNAPQTIFPKKLMFCTLSLTKSR